MSVPTVHHLDCAPMHPLGGAPLVAHCLLVVTGSGLVLIDTGLGTADVRDPRRLGAFFRRTMRPTLDLSWTAAHQIRALGYDPYDVQDIVLTHLDLDHAGGLADFPDARVHVMADEYRAAMRRDTRLDASRYVIAQWAHGPRWVVHDTADSDWHGFAAARVLRFPDILLVPLPGHTRGHCGVAVQQPDRWLLHAGDAYFHRVTIDGTARVPLGIRLEETSTQTDRAARLTTVDRLRAAHRAGVDVICAHDPVEYERHAGTRG